MSIVVKTQKDWDELKEFKTFTVVEIRSEEKIIINKACGNSRVVARDNSRVVAWGNSQVEARENSQVVARENSRVVACENSRVEARDNSQVEACENSRVEARDNSQVEARGNSRVVASNECNVIVLSSSATIIAKHFVTVLNKVKNKNIKHTNKSLIIVPTYSSWFEKEAVKQINKTNVLLYKKVSKDFKTQEGTKNETLWEIGKVLEHTNWNPEGSECGEGKFHACSTPYFCDEFRNENGDRYIALSVNIKDTYEWKNGSWPHKIAFRKGKVLYECNKFGERIE